MAEDKLESGGRKNSYKRDRDWEMDDENEYEDDEPNFSDAEDYVDNILEDGKTSKIVVIYHARAGTSSSLDHSWLIAEPVFRGKPERQPSDTDSPAVWEFLPLSRYFW